MFPYSYALEKLTNAVRILAVGEGDVRSRLWPAFLEFHTLEPDDLPPDLAPDYEWVIRELTRRPTEQHEWSETMQKWVPEGVVPANLRRMINRTGSRIAQKIYDLSTKLELRYEDWPHTAQDLSHPQDRSAPA